MALKIRYAFPPLALVCLFGPIASAQELPGNWRDVDMANAWQGQCDVAGRGGCLVGSTFYFDSDAGFL